jgi:hypothetical protein
LKDHADSGVADDADLVFGGYSLCGLHSLKDYADSGVADDAGLVFGGYSLCSLHSLKDYADSGVAYSGFPPTLFAVLTL